MENFLVIFKIFFFVDSFPYDDILNDKITKSARIVVNKFKEIPVEVKHTSIRRKGVLNPFRPDVAKRQQFCRRGVRDFKKTRP